MDEIQAGPEFILRNEVERFDPPGVHDRCIEPRLETLVKKDRVERLPGNRIQPERDI